MPDDQVGVLIDFENVGSANLHNLFDQLSEVGRIIVKRAYADWTKLARKGEEMMELGVEARHYFRMSGSGKNASDICLAIDAIDLLHRTPIDTFVIVSSDTDFVPLVSTLRGSGKTVIGAGHRGVVSSALVHSCDRFIYLDDGKSAQRDTSALSKQADQLLRRAMDTSVDEQGLVVAAKLHNTMKRMDPSFDYRTLGYRTFSQYLSSSKVIEIQRRGGDHGDVIVGMADQSRGSQSSQTVQPPPASQPAQPPPTSQPVQPPPTSQPAQPPPTSQTSERNRGNASPWDEDIDIAWAMIPGNPISGSKASSAAAKVLGVSKLSSSAYKSLQGLLDASELLSARWYRRGNSIVPVDLSGDNIRSTPGSN